MNLFKMVSLSNHSDLPSVLRRLSSVLKFLISCSPDTHTLVP